MIAICVCRGAKLLFGDQTLFCRAADFARVGGYDAELTIMEDADLCVRMHMAGPAPVQAAGSAAAKVWAVVCLLACVCFLVARPAGVHAV